MLPSLYGEVSIPPAVEVEVKPSSIDPLHLPWLKVAAVSDQHAVAQLRQAYRRLGPGEAEAIVLASQTSARLLIDERLGARIADQRGIRNTGLLGVLLVAKSRALVPVLRPILDALEAMDFYLSSELISVVLRRAGET